jgi:uncharacterized RDD family membrane protein YckC
VSSPSEGAASQHVGGRLKDHIRHDVEVIESPVVAPDVYAGIVTRSIAFALDAAVINAVAAVTGVIIGLGLSILHLPSQTAAILAAILGAFWIAWSILYFVFFWSSTGETPGSRLMGIRVIDSQTHKPLKPLQGAARFGGLLLGAIPLLAGYWIMLWDDRRRALQDRLARTVVVDISVLEPHHPDRHLDEQLDEDRLKRPGG